MAVQPSIFITIKRQRRRRRRRRRPHISHTSEKNNLASWLTSASAQSDKRLDHQFCLRAANRVDKRAPFKACRAFIIKGKEKLNPYSYTPERAQIVVARVHDGLFLTLSSTTTTTTCNCAILEAVHKYLCKSCVRARARSQTLAQTNKNELRHRARARVLPVDDDGDASKQASKQVSRQAVRQALKFLTHHKATGRLPDCQT